MRLRSRNPGSQEASVPQTVLYSPGLRLDSLIVRLVPFRALRNYGCLNFVPVRLRVVPLRNSSEGVCQNCKRLLAPSFCLCPYYGWKRRESASEGSSPQPLYVLPKVKERASKVGAAVRSGV